MGFGLHSSLHSPYYTGAGSSALASAAVTEAALGGHAYRIDWKSEIPLRHVSVPVTRAQADQSEAPGEQSVNPEGFWRRVGESWHFGAGQEQFDRKDSNPFRFNGSLGIDVWTKWQFSLLPATDGKVISNATNLQLAVAGSRLYSTRGTVLEYTTDITAGTPSWTVVTGTPGTQPSSIISDGFNVWTAHGASGIYKTTRTTGSTASHITGTVSLLGYVRNRVLAANAGILYDVTALAVGAGPNPLPTPLFTHGNTDWSWVGFAEGSGFIYIAGFSGDKSLIYRTAVKEDGTALSSPAVAAELPDGEIIRHINGYLGRFIFIGTDKGWRLAVVTGNGDLSVGARVNTPQPVLCSEGQEEFIWFGWGNYDSTHTGLGRLSTSTFSDLSNLVPAYASDLMVAGQTNNTRSLVTFQNIRVFAIDQIGLFAQDTLLEPDGYIDTGLISYGMTESKVGMFITAQHTGDQGLHEILVALDGGPFVSLGTHTHDDFPLGLGEVRANYFEIRHKIYRDTVVTTAGLTVNNFLFTVQPQPIVTRMIFATVFLADEVESIDDTPLNFNTYSELGFLEELHSAKAVTTWQQGDISYSVVLDDYEMNFHNLLHGRDGHVGFNGSVTLRMKRVN